MINKLLSRITSISSIERVADKLTSRAQYTKTVDEEFEDLVEEFDAIENALLSLVQSNDYFVSSLKETLKSSERSANLFRLLTYQESIVSNTKDQERYSWDSTKSYIAALKEILYSINDPLDTYSSIIDKKIEELTRLSKKIGEKISSRDKALLNYDRVYEKYDQMTIQSTSQKLSPKELQRYNSLEAKMRSRKREFDNWNSILKMELPTYFILVRNFTEPLVSFYVFTHLTVAYQSKLNLMSIMPHFDAEKTILDPAFFKTLLDHHGVMSKKLPQFHSRFGIGKLLLRSRNAAENADAIEPSVESDGGTQLLQCHQRVEYCRAIFNFASDDSSDLKFSKGDLIQIIDRKGDWWIGQFKGKKGLFPSNYVELKS